MKKFIGVMYLSVLLALFAGCSTGNEPAGGDDPRAVAEQVPVVAAQALTLRFGLGSEVGLQEVGEQEAASLLVEDVDGYPLVYLTVLGPEAKGSFWEAARAAVAAGEGHYLVATGASTLYSPTLFADTGVDTLEHLLSVVDEMGGPAAVERVVGFNDPGRYFLVDREERYWDAYTGEAVGDDEVAQLTQAFHDTVERLAGEDDYRAEMAHVWACLLGEASEEECQAEDASAEALEAREAEAELLSKLGYDPVSVQQVEAQPQAEGMDLAAMTGPDGELDFAKAQGVIEKGGAGNFSSFEEVQPQWRKKYCAGWFCYGEYWVLEARDKDTNKVRKDYEWHTVGGNWQNWKHYGYRWKDYFDSGHNDQYPPNAPNDGYYEGLLHYPRQFKDSNWKNFTYWHVTDPTGPHQALPIGCGPAAFIRLVSWYQFERNQYRGWANINWYGGSVPDLYYGPTSSWYYMYRKNSWLGGRMLAFHKQNYGGSKAYYPDLIVKMGTKALSGQGMTTPRGFYNGGNAWLDERGSWLNLRGAWYYGSPTTAIRWGMYSLAMDSIGVRGVPGIALYHVDPTALGEHYAPTLEGRLYNWRTTAEVLVRIPWYETGGPNDGKFLNITGILPTLRAGGYYALK